MANPVKAFPIRSILLAILVVFSGAWLHADPLEATIVSPNATLVATGQSLNFVASSGDGGRLNYVVTSCTWSFGDGSTSSSSTVNHAYTSVGTYTATLTVTYSYQICKTRDLDNNCLTYQSKTGAASTSRSITVMDPPKVTSFSASATTVRAGLPVTFNWGSANASSLSLSGVGAVSGTSTVVYPTTTTTYTLTASNSVGTDYAAIRVTVYTVGVTINPPSASLLFGESRSFSAAVSPANQGVSWSTSGGSMNGGTYTGTAPGTYSVTATSLEDPTKSASATVSIASVSVNTPLPVNASVNAGGTLQFSSAVSGAANAGLAWSVSGGGYISPGGLYTASTAGTFTVIATSLADPSKQASTTVTVNSVVTGVNINPPSAGLKAGEGNTFTASASGLGGNNTAVTWSANGGSVSSGGVYTAPLQGGTYSVTATSVQDPSKSASATVSVATISVSAPTPTNGSVNAGNTLQFTATVSGAVNAGLVWSASGGGSISPSGLFSATTAGSYTVTAKSAADASKQASTTVTVNSVVSGVSISPTSINLKAGEGNTFTASASGLGGNNTAVTWSANGGSISSGGVYTAPLQGGTYSVTATSVQDPSKFASATVSVATISVSAPTPTNGSVNAGSALQFTATVSGAVNTGLIWSVSGGGSISSSGLFSATTAGSYTVTAKSAVDASKQAITTVTVKAVVTGLSVTPGSAVLNVGDTLAFAAGVSGNGGVSQAVTWSCSNGTITANGSFTAPGQAGSITITAASVQDPTKTGTATVRVKGWVLKWKKDIIYVGTREIAEVDPLGLHVTLVDHLGSPRFQVNQSGTVEAEQKFLPFGESLANPTTAGMFAKGFTNHEQTDPSGLIYMQARFYAPWYGRFLSPDPARDQHFEETQSWNIYSYVQNNPVMNTDPTGMFLNPGDFIRIASSLITQYALSRDTNRMAQPIKNPTASYKSGGRQFGAARDDGRLHAGADLLRPKGDTSAVYALKGGTVQTDPYKFYAGTYAVEVKNKDGSVTRYGEIGATVPADAAKGKIVEAGQQIGNLTPNTNDGNSMLHIEMYSGAGSGSLTDKGSPGYQRRSDLINPTPALDTVYKKNEEPKKKEDKK